MLKQDCHPAAAPSMSEVLEAIAGIVSGDSDADHYASAAAAAYDRGQFDRAIARYSRAIHLAPDEPTHYAGRAAAHVGNGAYRLAVDDYSRAIDLAPGYAPLYHERSLAFAALGFIALAREDMAVAVAVGQRQRRVARRSSPSTNWRNVVSRSGSRPM